MSDTELTTVTSSSEKSKSLKMYSNKSIKVLNTKLNINASKVTFSNEITVFFVDSYKKYNKLFIKSISQEGEEDTDCGCQCFIF